MSGAVRALLLAGTAILVAPLASTDDLRWINNPKQWHQQTARTVDHRFSTLAELRSFAREAKQAGVSTLMLVGVNKISACPGAWYGGLQLCNHINGSFPAADGTLAEWKEMLDEIKPMRLGWWWNPAYWSVQGKVWAQAAQNPGSDVGSWFSWHANESDGCYGACPCTQTPFGCAQGSWGSEGAFQGVDSALASFGSDEYAHYLVESLADSWTRNLGIDHFCTDCSGDYGPVPKKGCPTGMRRVRGDALAAFAGIVGRVRAKQPQTVWSGEYYSSWAEVIHADADVGGQGFAGYHEAMQAAVANGDASGLEDVASTSGADAATMLCYLHPHYDGRQPGACPTMYFRDATRTLTDTGQHRLWVALEAGAGIVPQHDAVLDDYWSPPNDPTDGTRSPLWAFTRYRALNRLALRTKLPVTGNAGALAYLKHDALGPYGDAALLLYNPGASGAVTVDLSMLPSALLRAGVVPLDLFVADGAAAIGDDGDKAGASLPPLAASWTVQMPARSARAFSGFSLGVFAPRKGKRGICTADDAYSAHANATTLQGCFLECADDPRCRNVLVIGEAPTWMERPAQVHCKLLGAIADPATACKGGNATLVSALPGARSCAQDWQDAGAVPTPAPGAPPVAPGPPSDKCLH
eukprot:g2167.t1